MKNIPVYTTEDGQLTLADNGTQSTPLHLLKPAQAFTFVSAMSEQEQDEIGAYFTDLTGDGRLFMLYLGLFEPVCAQHVTDMGMVSYLHPEGALDVLSTIEHDRSSPDALRKRLMEAVGANITAEQAAANRRRFDKLIESVQRLASHTLQMSVVVVQPEDWHGQGEARGVVEGESSMCKEYMNLLLEPLQLCDSFTVEQGEQPNQLHLCFFVDYCLSRGRS